MCANTRWFKYDRDCLCVNESQFVPVIFERPCTKTFLYLTSLVNLAESRSPSLQAAQRSPLLRFARSQAAHVLVQCIAVNISFLVIVFILFYKLNHET
jgi:hypothetical protein